MLDYNFSAYFLLVLINVVTGVNDIDFALATVALSKIRK